MFKKNIFSFLVALIIMYLSLTGADTFENIPTFNIPFLDKIVHMGMYFVLMSVIIFENRRSLTETKHIFLTALIPLFYGILMEFLQANLTSTRSGSIYDILFNFLGIFASIIIWFWIRPRIKESIR